MAIVLADLKKARIQNAFARNSESKLTTRNSRAIATAYYTINLKGNKMNSLEPKKLALLRILDILKKHSDFNHLVTHEDIIHYLINDYGIDIERKAVARNITLLREAGYEIYTSRKGSYLEARELEDSELRMLIDGVLCSKYITASHSKALIEKLCGLTSKYFKSHIKNVFSVNDWSKTDNQALFYNIEIIDEAIDIGKQITFDYNKFGVDKRLRKTKAHTVSPYQLILNNQRYYLMALNEKWKNIGFYRLDHITNMRICGRYNITPINEVEGYERGIDYKTLSSALPYMYTDKPERVEMIADTCIIDQIIDWFGKDISITKIDDTHIVVSLITSLNAMEHWAMQYAKHIEIKKPESLRDRVIKGLENALEKYKA